MSTIGIITFPIRLLSVMIWAMTIWPIGWILTGCADNDALDFLFLRGRFHKDFDNGGY